MRLYGSTDPPSSSHGRGSRLSNNEDGSDDITRTIESARDDPSIKQQEELERIRVSINSLFREGSSQSFIRDSEEGTSLIASKYEKNSKKKVDQSAVVKVATVFGLFVSVFLIALGLSLYKEASIEVADP